MTVGILNVGAGDTKLAFDKANPAEAIRAGRIVRDMLRRGYALLVEVERDGKRRYERALDFDENTQEYLIADFDPVQAAEQDAGEDWDARVRGERSVPAVAQRTPNPPSAGSTPAPLAQDDAPPKRDGRRAPKPGRRRVKADSAKAVAVSRSAGG